MLHIIIMFDHTIQSQYVRSHFYYENNHSWLLKLYGLYIYIYIKNKISFKFFWKLLIIECHSGETILIILIYL